MCLSNALRMEAYGDDAERSGDEEVAELFRKAQADSRKGADPDTSYTARLFSRGRQKIAKKLGEEAVETVIEGIRGDRPKLVGESADMLYHLLTLWAANNVRPQAVWNELARREGLSGIAEKAARKRK